MSAVPNLHVVWNGVFVNGLDRKTYKIEFNAVDEDSARDIIEQYVESKTARGLRLIENSVQVSYIH